MESATSPHQTQVELYSFDHGSKEDVYMYMYMCPACIWTQVNLLHSGVYVTNPTPN